MNSPHKATRFRDLHQAGDPLVLFNAWDAGSARAVAAAGAAAIATGSWSVAAAHGMADGEALPKELVLANARRIVAATDLPVSIDGESGYGAEPAAVAEFIAELADTGAVGVNLEDSRPHDNSLRDPAEQAERLAAARQAAGPEFFINARTDVFLKAAGPQDHASLVSEALDRARAYAAAGASGLFVPGLGDSELIAQVTKASPLPVNVMLSDTTINRAQLAELGVARISYGPHPYQLAMQALKDNAQSVLA
jgi:2-methylisocitrate lyase-like PEP mutase family enzyme